MRSIKTQFKPDNKGFRDVPKSKGILDDFAVRKNIASREGSVEKVPVNDSDIVNKKYLDETASNYVPYTGATQNVDLGTYNIAAGWNSKFGSATQYWKVEELNLGAIGTYPMFAAYSDGPVFGNIGTIADSLNIYDKANAGVGSLSFSANDLSNIGQIEYDNNNNKFTFKEAYANDVDVEISNDLNVVGDITGANLSGTNTGDQTLPVNSDFDLADLGDVDNTSIGIGKILKIGADGVTHEYVDDETGTDEKVKYDVSDPTAGYIADKFIAGDGISVAEGIGVNENKLVITNDDKGSDVNLSGLVPYTGATTNVDLGDKQLKVTRATNETGLYINKTTGTQYSAYIRGYNGLDLISYNIINGLALNATGRVAISSNLIVDIDTFFVDATNDRVGIGTTTPSEKLDVDGSVNISNDLTLGKNIDLANTTTTTTGVIFKNGTSFLHNFKHPTGNTAIPSGYNIFLGEGAGNFTIGSGATDTNQGSFNVGIGRSALSKATTARFNVSIGDLALRDITTGYGNVGIGINTGYLITSGQNNITMGYYAGDRITTGHQNICIGALSDVSAAGDINEIAIGYNVTGKGSNTVTIGNSSITDNYFQGNIVEQKGTGAFYFGPKTTSGSWRIIRSGSNLVFQRYEGDPLAWVTKSTISA